MKTPPALPFFAAIFIVWSLACSLGVPQVSKIKTGPTQTFRMIEPYPNTDAVQDVNLIMAIGEFNLAGGTESFLEGEIRYSVADWKPTVTRNDNSLPVSQSETGNTVRGFAGEDIMNNWTVRLGNTPMNLTLRAGACNAALDLSGLPLKRLDIQDGASHSEIRFDTLNPEKMLSLSYSTAASAVTMIGLANANFAQMTFEGGAGDYTFDFSGNLQQDANISIKVALSNVQILVPVDIAAQVIVNGKPAEVSSNGAWTQESNHYVNKGSGFQLTITVEMGGGNLYLVNR